MPTEGDSVRSPIRVVIADDHRLVLSAFSGLLDSFPGVEVVGAAHDGPEMLRLAESLDFDVALVDILMPGLNGLEVTRRLRQADPDCRIVILSMYGEKEYVLRALREGACGFVLKDADPGELEYAVRSAALGNTFLCPSIARQVVANWLQQVDRSDGATETPLLTDRQREIVQLVCEGRSTKEIARLLGLSIKTVENHRSEAMRRLGVHNVAGLVTEALRLGMLPVADRPDQG